MLTLEQAMTKASKLLKLAESSNANEAALAAQRAQEILARYDIDRASLGASDGGDSEPLENIKRFDGENGIDRGNASIARWKLSLASAIGRANSCRVYKSGASIGIVGRKSDVVKVRYFYIMLCEEIDKLTNSKAKGMGRNYRTEFRHGVVSAVSDKLQDAKQKVAQDMRQEAQASGNSAALVSLNRGLERLDQRQRDVDAWCRANMNFRKSPSYRNVNSDARSAGYSAGQSLNVGGNRARAALGVGQKMLK